MPLAVHPHGVGADVGIFDRTGERITSGLAFSFHWQRSPGLGAVDQLAQLVAFQTADVEICSRTMRAVALVHGVVAFFFNTTIVALMVNISSQYV